MFDHLLGLLLLPVTLLFGGGDLDANDRPVPAPAAQEQGIVTPPGEEGGVFRDARGQVTPPGEEGGVKRDARGRVGEGVKRDARGQVGEGVKRDGRPRR